MSEHINEDEKRNKVHNHGVSNLKIPKPKNYHIVWGNSSSK